MAQDKKQNIIENFKEVLIKTLIMVGVFIIQYEGLSTMFTGLDDPLLLKLMKSLVRKHWISMIAFFFFANVISVFLRNSDENTKNTFCL